MLEAVNLRRQYGKVYNSLGRAQLQSGLDDHDEMSFEDLLFDEPEELWLGYYTLEGIELAFESYGIMDDLRELGYEELRVTMGRDSTDAQLLRVFSDRPRLESPLVETLAQRSYLNLSEDLAVQFAVTALPVLSSEWVMLQHPLGTFRANRPPLPEQRYPGQGLSAKVFELLRLAMKRLNLCAMVNVPSYFHNAVFYSQGFTYMDPRYEGKLDALMRDVLGHPRLIERFGEDMMVAVATWAINWGCVVDEDGELFQWFHEPMVSARSPVLADYFTSSWFQRERAREAEESSYSVMVPAVAALLEYKGLIPFELEVIEAWLEEEHRGM